MENIKSGTTAINEILKYSFVIPGYQRGYRWTENQVKDLLDDVLDFSKGDFTPKEYKTNADLLALHDDLVAKAEKILTEIDEAEFDKPWTMRNGDIVYFTMPKKNVVRTWCLNHLFHHRGQLTVYLRLLNIPLPGIYGPSADSAG